MDALSLVQVSGKRNLSKSVNTTESALASKIRKTQETKARLEKTILDVDLEMQNLTRTSAKLTKLLGRRKASLHTAEKRMQVSEQSACFMQSDHRCIPEQGLHY